jgi:hypothetical protein
MQKFKIQSKILHQRVIYVSWVPDDSEHASKCVGTFSIKLKAIQEDDYDAPISVIDSQMWTAGDRRDIPTMLEHLHAVTDFVGFFSDSYFNPVLRSDKTRSDIDHFLERRREEHESGEPSTLAMWYALVDMLDINKVSPTRQYNGTWWHAFREGRLSVETPVVVNDQLYDAIKALLHHKGQECEHCNANYQPAFMQGHDGIGGFVRRAVRRLRGDSDDSTH